MEQVSIQAAPNAGMVSNLDDIDRGILHALQANARAATATDMGDMVGVSASSVRNRIDRLEEAGVILGYHPGIDYGQAGFQHHVFVVGQAPTARRTEVATRALELPGVINVREMTTGTDSLHIEAVAVDADAVDETLAGIEALDLDIVSTQIVKDLHVQPFDHFGANFVVD